MVAKVVRQDVVTCVGQVFVLHDKVNLDWLDEIAPRRAHVARVASPAHGQRVVEDDQPITLAATSRNVPRLERRPIIRLDGNVVPSLHAVLVGVLKDEAPGHLDHACQRLDLVVILCRDGPFLRLGGLHPFFRNASHGFCWCGVFQDQLMVSLLRRGRKGNRDAIEGGVE